MSQHPSQVATGGHLGDDNADLWQRAERLCRAVAAQELADLPLYIVPQSRLAELGFSGDQHGLTCLSLDLFVREYLEEYRGRGPAMVINADAIREYHHPDDVDYIILATVLHDPLRNWSRLDFEIADRDGSICPKGKGLQARSQQGNIVLLHSIEADFHFSVDGFDRNRDLYVRVDDVSNSEHARHD